MSRHCRIAVYLASMFAGIAAAVVQTPEARAGSVVRFELNYSVSVGDNLLNYFDVELYDDEAPITVANFLQYVNNGQYDNVILHRSILDFVVQGGGFTPTVEDGTVTALTPITSYGPIINEFSASRSNVSGTIAMAKSPDNPDSATNQWFVNVADNSANLDSQNGGFTVFGAILGDGMSLIHSINSLPTYDLSSSFGDSFTDVPMFNDGTSFVTITSASLLNSPTQPETPTSSTGKLSGVAYVDVNGNGVMDGDDYVIAGAKITITQAGSKKPLATVTTAADGSYHFENLPVGTFSVQLLDTCSQGGQDTGAGRMVFDAKGNILSVGTAGTALSASYGDIALGEGQSGANFNIAQAAYPPSLISARMLLNTFPGIPNTTPVAAPGTNVAAGNTLDFGNILVGTSGSASLSVTNVGGQGSTLSGTFPGAEGEFASAGDTAFGPLEAGQDAAREYSFAPTARGASEQSIVLATSAGNMPITLAGVGVAPVSSVAQDVPGYALVGSAGTATVTVKNIGDGNLSGLGEVSNLQGSVSGGSGNFTGDGGDFSLADGASATFQYHFALTMRGETKSATITASFSNGSPNGTNSAHSQDIVLSVMGVAPVQSVDATAAQAGLVRIGTTGTAAFTISNLGDGNLSGLGEESNLRGEVSAGSGNFAGDGGSFSLIDDGTQTFSFAYTPTAHAVDVAPIAVSFTNGSADGLNLAETVHVELGGQGVGPVFSGDLDPSATLDFGTVPQADTKSLFLTITNVTTDPNDGNTELTALTILNAEITGTDAGLFSILGFTPGTVLQAGESLSLEIFYDGSGEHGDRSAWLTVYTDEGAAFGLDGHSFGYAINASLAPEPGSLVLLAVAGLVLGGLYFSAAGRRMGK